MVSIRLSGDGNGWGTLPIPPLSVGARSPIHEFTSVTQNESHESGLAIARSESLSIGAMRQSNKEFSSPSR